MLHFNAKPPISFEKFLSMCDTVISGEDMSIIKASLVSEEENRKAANLTLQSKADMPQTYRKWHAFDISLRNELVKIRAARKKIDPNRYLRYGGYEDASIAHIALHAHRTSSILESESVLDQAKWQFLDELAVGHYFDIDFLIVYANKLSILEKWDKINVLDKAQAVEKVLEPADSR
jgi:hypothetical protein